MYQTKVPEPVMSPLASKPTGCMVPG